MINELVVENIATIEKAQISFGPGFTVLTGETGAGKSLLLDALHLVLGGRADSMLLRSGCSQSTIDLVADISSNSEALRLCDEFGIFIEDSILYIQRTLNSNGKSICRLNGRQTPLNILKSIGELLVDIHGQHEHQSLLNPKNHLKFLDSWIGKDFSALLDEHGNAYRELQRLKKELYELNNNLHEKRQRRELLAYQIKEIKDTGLKAGELEELEGQLYLFRNAERIKKGINQVLTILEGEDDSVGVVSGLSHAVKEIDFLVKENKIVDESRLSLQESYYIIEEVISRLHNYVQEIEYDPCHVDILVERISLIKKLLHKYGGSEESVMNYLLESRRELEKHENFDEIQFNLKKAVEEQEKKLVNLSEKVSEIRKSKSKFFENEIENQLKDLALGNSRFEVSFASKEVGLNGKDEVEFLFSANKGENLKPLSKTASGGEISRIMLALKAVSKGRSGVPTLIFDEVDSGLSGKAASQIGAKLDELGKFNQVIVISHLPQVASVAVQHIRIEKVIKNERVTTGLLSLAGEERVAEIARMLAGSKIGDSALANAKELLSR